MAATKNNDLRLRKMQLVLLNGDTNEVFPDRRHGFKFPEFTGELNY